MDPAAARLELTCGSITPAVAAENVPLSRLRPLWLALPVLPWLASHVHWFAPELSATWLLLAIYFWPAHRIAASFGVPLASPSHPLILLAYSLALAAIVEAAMRIAGRKRGAWRQIGRRTASRVAAAFAVAVLGVFAVRYAQWIDWPARPAPADHPLAGLGDRAALVRELFVYELPGGFIDTEYVARLRAEPALLPALIDSWSLEPVPPDGVPDAFWTAPPAYWWNPPRTGEFYATRDFPWTGRGRDGDHYFLLRVPDRDELWLWYKRNF